MKNYRSILAITFTGLLACACNETQFAENEPEENSECKTTEDCSKAECKDAAICQSTKLCSSLADCNRAECQDKPFCQTQSQCSSVEDCTKAECANAAICQSGESCNSASDCSKPECANAAICQSSESCKTADDCSKPECANADICKSHERTVGWCKVTYAETPIDNNKALQVYSEVYAEGLTGVNSAHTGLTAQMGYVVAEDGKTFEDVTWSNASINNSFDRGDNTDKQNNDEYMSNNIIPMCNGAECSAGTSLAVFYRYKTDDSEDWTYCDGDGVATTIDLSKATKVTLQAPAVVVPDGTPTWCQITYYEHEIESDHAFQIYSQVYAKGVTGTSGSHTGLVAQMGYGIKDKITGFEGLVWTNATRNSSFNGDGSDNNDEYMSTDVLPPEIGEYGIFYRYSADVDKPDAEKSWLYCDTEKETTAFDISKAATVVVKEPPVQLPEGTPTWCQLSYAETPILTGDTFKVYSQVNAERSTGTSGSHSKLLAQFGSVLVDEAIMSYPPSAVTRVSWKNAVRNEAFAGAGVNDNDEYMSVDVPAETAGMYAVFYRYKADDGKPATDMDWMYCDKTGILNMESANLQNFQFVNVNAPVIDYCEVTYAENPINKDSALQVYSQVHVAGITGESNKHTGIKAQMGYISETEIMQLSDIVWTDAVRNDKFAGGAAKENDEYMSTDVTMSETGRYAVVFRYSVDNGNTWSYCNSKPDMPTEESLLEPQNLTIVQVKDPGTTIDPDEEIWCKVVYSESPIAKGETFKTYSEVYAKGITGESGTHTGLKAQFGYTTNSETIDSKTIQWSDAARNTDFAGASVKANDEYMSLDVNAPDYGTYAVFYRYSDDDGETWTYCNKNGVAALDVEVISDPVVVEVTNKINWCQVIYTETPIVQGSTIKAYSQVNAKGITGTDGTHKGLKAQIGYVKNADSINFADIEWADATRNESFSGAGSDKNDEYMSTDVTISNDGTYAIFYRYSDDDGATWTYCNNDGKATEESVVAKPTIVEVVDIDWCKVNYAENPISKDSTFKVYSQVYAKGITGKSGTHNSLKAEIGYALLDEAFMAKLTTNPTGIVDDITFSAAVRNTEFNGEGSDNNDEYMSLDIKPAAAGTYGFIYRYSGDGKTWKYCDGAGVLTFKKLDPKNITQVTVNE